MEKRKLPKIKAYAVSVKAWQGATVGITGAVSRSNAISRNLFSATDAGYALKFTDFRAVRAPDFDAVVEKHGTGCWTLEYARLLQRDMPANASFSRGPSGPSVGSDS